MQLVLPNNYVELEQEEMMYLDGGDFNNFKNNIKGLININRNVSHALRGTAFMSILMANVKLSFWYTMSLLGPYTAVVSAALGQ